MLRIAAICVLLSVAASARSQTADTNAATATPIARPKISSAEAPKFHQQLVVVTGQVAQVTIREKLVYVNLDKKFPETPLAAIIFDRATNQFGDLKRLEGKRVEIEGRIEEYRNRLQIVLNRTNQLRVLDTP